MVSVADDGAGMDPERRRAALTEGHIGLASVTQRVEANGGELQIQATPGSGTQVSARARRLRGRARGSNSAGPEPEAPGGSGSDGGSSGGSTTGGGSPGTITPSESPGFVGIVPPPLFGSPTVASSAGASAAGSAAGACSVTGAGSGSTGASAAGASAGAAGSSAGRGRGRRRRGRADVGRAMHRAVRRADHRGGVLLDGRGANGRGVRCDVLHLDRSGGQESHARHARCRLGAQRAGAQGRGSAACEAEAATTGCGRARDARAAGARPRAADTSACAGRASGTRLRSANSELRRESVCECGERADRHQRGERLAVPAKLGAVVAAAIAVLHMEASGAGHLPEALGRLGKLQVDLVAGQVAALACVGQGHAGPDQERLDGGDRCVHRDRDLLIGEGVDLAKEQRAPLRLGQPLDVKDERPELSALLDLLRNRGAVLVRVDVHGILALGHGLAKVVEAAVAGDAVEPRPRVDRAVVGEDRLVGGNVDLLEHVLGVLG